MFISIIFTTVTSLTILYRETLKTTTFYTTCHYFHYSYVLLKTNVKSQSSFLLYCHYAESGSYLLCSKLCWLVPSKSYLFHVWHLCLFSKMMTLTEMMTHKYLMTFTNQIFQYIAAYQSYSIAGACVTI